MIMLVFVHVYLLDLSSMYERTTCDFCISEPGSKLF
jgi:hypothetical protein